MKLFLVMSVMFFFFTFPTDILAQTSLCDNSFVLTQETRTQFLSENVYLVDPWGDIDTGSSDLGTFYVKPFNDNCTSNCALGRAGYLFNRTPLRLMLRGGDAIRLYSSKDNKFYYKFLSISGEVGYVRCDRIKKYDAEVFDRTLREHSILFPLVKDVGIYKDEGAVEPSQKMLDVSYEDKRLVVVDGSTVLNKKNRDGMTVEFLRACYNENGIRCGLVKYNSKDYLLLHVSDRFHPIREFPEANYFGGYGVKSKGSNLGDLLKAIQSCQGEKKISFETEIGIDSNLIPFFNFSSSIGIDITYIAPEGFVYKRISYNGSWGHCSIYYKIQCWGEYPILGADAIYVTLGGDNSLQFLFCRSDLERSCGRACRKVRATGAQDGRPKKYMFSISQNISSMRGGSTPYLVYTGFLKGFSRVLFARENRFPLEAFGVSNLLVNQLIQAEPESWE